MRANRQIMRTVMGVMMALSCRVAQGQFAVEPLRTELEGEPGAVIHGRFVVSHGRDVPMDLDLAFQDHSISPTTYPEWMQFEALRHVVDPDLQSTISYTITVPTNASGELYGRVAFSEALPEDQGVVSIRTRLSLPVYVTLRGTEQYAGAIEDVSLLSAAPLKVRMKVENSGNVHVRSRAEIQITDAETGEPVLVEPMQKDAAVYYPGQTRDVVSTSVRKLKPGRYRARITIPFPDAERALTHAFDIDVPETSKEQSESEPEA